MCDIILNRDNIATNHTIFNHSYLNFCSRCVNDEGWDINHGENFETDDENFETDDEEFETDDEEFETDDEEFKIDDKNSNIIIPKELMTIISYFLENPLDIINACKSKVFPPMGEKEYWINRLHFDFPNIPCYITRQFLIRYDYFYRSIDFYFEILDDAKSLFKKYLYYFQRNDTYCMSDNKIKVLYHYYGKDHEGYCSDNEEEKDMDEYMEYTYNLPEDNKNTIFCIPREILTITRFHYMGCNETFCRILSVTYIKDKSHIKKKDMTKNYNNQKDEIIQKFGQSETKLKENYDITIICEFCNQTSISNSNMIKCKYCYQ